MSRSTTGSPSTDPEDTSGLTIVVPVVLGSVIVILVAVLAVSVLVFLKKRRKLCCGDDYDDVKPFLLSDKELEKKADKKRLQYEKKSKNQSKPKKKKRKGGDVRYQSLGRAQRFPARDPFSKKFIGNPLADHDEAQEDWSNPLFDTKHAAQRDAAITIQSWYRMIRVKVPYVELRSAVILAQAHYRGSLARRALPELRREKYLKDIMKKKPAGWKKKGTLSAMRFFDVKGFGFAEVEQLYGLETVRNAAEQLKSLYGGKGKMKLKLFISAKGLKLYDHQTLSQFAIVKISSVSFCTLDPKNKKIFAFINRKKRRNFCHVFQASEHDAQKMVETMAEAFEVTFKKLEEKREQAEAARVNQLKKKKLFNKKTKELDVELASMMEMAETASLGDRVSRRGSPVGSVSGSRERLLPAPSQSSQSSSNRSSLTTSLRAPPTHTEDVVNMGLPQSEVPMISSLTRERKQVELEIENHRLNSNIENMVNRFT